MISEEEGPLFGWGCALKGFLAGSLIVGSIINDSGFVMQSLLFLLGIFVFLDGIIYVTKDANIGIVILTLILGGLASGISTILGLSLGYLVAVFLVTLALYLFVCRHWLRKKGKNIPRARRKGHQDKRPSTT